MDGTGRPPFRIGIDLGGTKTEAIVLSSVGEVLVQERVPTLKGSYEATIETIRALVSGAEAKVGQRCSVGIGIPGTVSRDTGLVKNANSTWLIGHPLHRDLEAALERPVRLQNDANCFAVSEAVDGAGKGAEIVFGVILGTGVGAGIAIRREALEGRNGIAGEWGHNPLPAPRDDERPGVKCYCGRHGCIETFLCGPALERQYRAAAGQFADAREIAARAEAGEKVAETVLQRYEERLARALAHVINILDPDVIVLGGGLSNVRRFYESVPRLWEPHVFSDIVSTKLRPPVHGDSSGVRGAAWLWPHET
ncbi:ROK family protein [Nisaea acidiphila]|uniref:ROK family protein n=1 Tax=Nisaea acidiphila TaxID=1862145 RepID=A0A9J7AWW7_9PROT|nr:ROK family protein [Nisaea acidiphila]UUX50929.1 ROK family protein [Nisaea acidiphila]